MTGRVAILGAGAIGGALAAALHDAGHQVVLCSRRAEVALVVEGPGARRVEVGPVHADPAAVAGPFDVVILATKAQQTSSAASWLRILCGPQTLLAVAQNGIDHVERVRPVLAEVDRPDVAVVPVVVQLAAEREDDGRVVQHRSGVLFVPDDEHGRRFAALFPDGGSAVARARADFATAAWVKLMTNAAVGAIAALTLRRNGVLAEPDVGELALALMEEVAAVGRAEGAVLAADLPAVTFARVVAAVPEHWSSIAADRRAGRPLEWEARNAVVGRLGRRHGIATPLNDALTTLLRVAG